MTRISPIMAALCLGMAVCVVGDEKTDDPLHGVPAAAVEKNVFVVRGRFAVRNPTPGTAVREALEALNAATTHEELQGLMTKLRKDIRVGLRHQLIGALLRKMNSRRALKFTKPVGIPTIVGPYFTNQDIGEVIKAQEAGKPTLYYAHDIYIEGGRCAWALSEFLHLELLPVWGPMKDEEIAFAIRQNSLIVLASMPLPEEIDFELFDVAQRRALAQRSNNVVVLRRMVVDSDREVRMILARRVDLGYADENLIMDLRSDKDPEIAATAVKTFEAYLRKKYVEPQPQY